MVHDAAAQGYERHSATYAAARPSYHPDVIRMLATRLGAGRWIDIGAGTGISTRAFADRGIDIVGVEPVGAMREQFVSIAGVPMVAARSDMLPFRDSTASVVLAAQAFHWFAHGPTLDEVERVLRSDGSLVTLWNVRDYSVEWMRGWTDIVDRHAGDTPRDRTKIWRRAIERDARFRLADEVSVPNPQTSNADHVVARALSTSFIARLGASSQAAVAEGLRSLVEPLGESFDFPYLTETQIWSLA